MDQRLEWISEVGIVPTIKMEDVNKAVPLANALLEGGISVAEILFQTAAAEAAIRKISENCPDFLIGAGSVLTCKQVDRALEAGGKFVVTAEFDLKVIQYALSKGTLVIPSVSTLEEVEQAGNMGLNVVSFSFNERGDSMEALRAFASHHREIKWLPSGDIHRGTLLEYLACDQVLACRGAWMVKSELVQDSGWREITALCKEIVSAMLGFRVVHVGINCKDAAEAEQIARLFCSVFDVSYQPGETAIFAGSLAECIKGPYLGAHGHIAIGTNDVDRAIYHLKRRGVIFDEASRKVDSQGRTTLIYFQEEIGGFAIHLTKISLTHQMPDGRM